MRLLILLIFSFQSISAQNSWIKISTPWSRAVFQRSENNTANIPIEGTYAGLIEKIELRAVPMKEGQGKISTWTPAEIISEGKFIGKILAAGGWYKLEARGCMKGQ